MTLNKENAGFYTVREVAEILRLSEPTVVSRVKDGTLHAIKCGRVFRFEKSTFAEDLARMENFKYAPRVREKFPPR